MKLYRTHWKRETLLAKRLLKGEPVIMEDVWKNFICFKIHGPDYRIVVYPHKTSAFNYHLRVRDEGSKNKAEAERIMKKLDIGSGLNCTFSRKNT